MLRRTWPWALVTASAAALLLRWTVRDGSAWTAPVFYATPPAVVAAAAFVPIVAAWRSISRAAGDAGVRSRARRLAFASAFVLAGAVTDAGFTSVRTAPPSPPGAVRALFWNVFSGRLGWDRVAATIAEADPDVAWFSECAGAEDLANETMRDAFPSHVFRRVGGGMAVLVRGDVDVLEVRDLPRRGHAALERITVRGTTLHVLQVDIASHPLQERGPSFDVLDAMKAAHLDGPLLVVGDFNTPRDSVCFDAWRGPLARAFETAGCGWDATWPVPLPVLALDHVWASRSVTIRTCEHVGTVCSDHQPVRFTFDVAAAGPPAGGR